VQCCTIVHLQRENGSNKFLARLHCTAIVSICWMIISLIVHSSPASGQSFSRRNNIYSTHASATGTTWICSKPWPPCLCVKMCVMALEWSGSKTNSKMAASLISHARLQ
jgi:hypothetical protein